MQIYPDLTIHKPSLGTHTKFGPDQFSSFDIYRIQADKQTPRYANHIYIYSLTTL